MNPYGDMKITALAPWFGGKRNLASAIITELGEHSAYWEPFCGSMAILLAKPPSTNETVNDLHGDLVNLARVIQDSALASKLYRRLRRTLFCEGWHQDCQRFDDTTEPMERAYRYFVTCWMSLSGIAGTDRAESKLCIRYTSTGGNPAVRWQNAVGSIPAWRRRICKVRILNKDAFALFPNIPDDESVAIYCDPPYIVKGASYLHDFDDTDHDRLAADLRRFTRSRVVVSYYDHPSLADLYPGWTVRRLDAQKKLVCQSARDMQGVKADAPEVLLMNGPSYAENDSPLFAPSLQTKGLE